MKQINSEVFMGSAIMAYKYVNELFQKIEISNNGTSF